MRPLSTLALAISALALSVATAAPARAEGRDLTGASAPEIYAPQGLHGFTPGTTLGQFRGRVVVLKFFFTGCPTCRASLPAFEDLYRRYSAKGVQFIALAYDSRSAVESLMSANGYDFPVAIDPEGVTSGRYGVFSYPTNYVIGADGIVKAYDSLSTWTIDRELAVAAPARNPNVDELGPVPAPLADVKDAAAKNDYGQVLRIVEAHLDPAKDSHEVVAAATRIREDVVRARWNRRVARIQGLWSQGSQSSAYAESVQFAQDFHDTRFHEATVTWSQKLGRELAMASTPAGVVAGATAR